VEGGDSIGCGGRDLGIRDRLGNIVDVFVDGDVMVVDREFLVDDRSLANKRVFPAVNLTASSTRRDDLLQDQTTLNRMWVLRNHLADMTSMEAMDFVMKQIERTKNNEEFLISMNG
jgi:flagellar biosynthesis/type III secretory pathway ATPase